MEDYITHSLVECFTPMPVGLVAREIAEFEVLSLDRTVQAKIGHRLELLVPATLA
jgi:hypothetical protein